MESKSISDIISHGAYDLGIKLPPSAICGFEAYFDLLEKRGRDVNLTAITGAADVARLHFLDSLALLNSTDLASKRVIDVGSGAGFPGVPLKLAESSIELTLLDSSGKRISFLTELCTLLGLDVDCVQARAEDFAHDPNARELWDVAVSRGVSRLNMLCELCLPFVRIGGKFIAMKSIDSDDEISESTPAFSSLGSEYEGVYDYAIPGTDIMRRAVIIRKVSLTPTKYPRRFARIQKSPL